MNSEKIKIISRESELALWQANHVKVELERLHKGLIVEVEGISTEGDRIVDSPLSKIGGKGLFVKELEKALLDNRADIAVHSMKDVPYRLPEGLEIGAILKREVANDVYLSDKGEDFYSIASGSVIGTSSLRRETQLKSLRNDLIYKSIRGNVNTRILKMEKGNFDAIILAEAGIRRLGLANKIKYQFNFNEILPACGQGALGIELLSQNKRVKKLIEPLIDRETLCCVSAERAMNESLEGGCQVPIAGLAQLTGDNLVMEAKVLSIDASVICSSVKIKKINSVKDCVSLGRECADELIAKGARKIIQEVYAKL